MPQGHRGLPLAFVLAILTACAARAPQTAAEATRHARTSTLAEVEAFLSALPGLPHGGRITLASAGRSHEGRPLHVVGAALPPDPDRPRLRALIVANIHAGEVEGKEASLQILREIAMGGHRELLASIDLWFVPVYNVDGNERLSPDHRPEQNGPDLVGQRPNAQGLDLNRDFVKAEAPETQALLALFRRLDPHLFFDLHTTDGSWHGYDLTYAPSLSPNCDAAVAQHSRRLLEEAKASLAACTPPVRTFDYGNFETRDWDGGGAPQSDAGVRGWWTYDHRARYGVNCFGLRNRIGILSEAYSNAPFGERIAATRSFVLAVLSAAAASEDDLRAAMAQADAVPRRAPEPAQFGFATEFAPPTEAEVLVGDCTKSALPEGRGMRLARTAKAAPERMPVFASFRARRFVSMPRAWAIADAPPAVEQALQAHGIACRRLTAPVSARAERFVVGKALRPKRPFQGHQEVRLEGEWEAVQLEVEAGCLWIPADQPLFRLAATLLEPQSEDSLTTWNFFDARLSPHHPVLRILD